MTQSDLHPTIRKFREREEAGNPPARLSILDSAWLRKLCLDAGADDVGFVEASRPEVADQKPEITQLLRKTKTLISLVCRLNRDNVRPPTRSLANLEFHHGTDHVNDVTRKIVSALERLQVRAVNGGAAGFPMEADRWGTKMWLISHKPVAVAAGLGHIFPAQGSESRVGLGPQEDPHAGFTSPAAGLWSLFPRLKEQHDEQDANDSRSPHSRGTRSSRLRGHEPGRLMCDTPAEGIGWQ